ncbi:hypothetical protein YC2023_081118 [Brassica napus]
MTKGIKFSPLRYKSLLPLNEECTFENVSLVVVKMKNGTLKEDEPLGYQYQSVDFVELIQRNTALHSLLEKQMKQPKWLIYWSLVPNCIERTRITGKGSG